MTTSRTRRTSKKTGNNSRRTITQNTNGSRTISNSTKYSSGNRKTISNNSKTGRTRTTYTVVNNGGWISRTTTMSGASNTQHKRTTVKHREPKSMSYGSYDYDDISLYEHFCNESLIGKLCFIVVVIWYGSIALVCLSVVLIILWLLFFR
jgi:hypothetical protein